VIGVTPNNQKCYDDFERWVESPEGKRAYRLAQGGEISGALRMAFLAGEVAECATRDDE
jgi:hypothetical protein